MRALASLLLVTMCLSPLACGGKESPSTRRPDRSSRIPLPCFPDEGPAVCRIDGVVVPRKTFDRYVQVLREVNPSTTELAAGMATLERVLIPMVQGYSGAEGSLRQLSRRAWTAYDRIVYDRESFEAVASSVNEEQALAKVGGLLGAFGRKSKELGAMGAEFRSRFWSQPEGVPTQPFVEAYGIVILKITEDLGGGTPESLKRAVRVIRLLWPKREPRVGQAKVTDLADADFARFVPGVYR